jgi:hypothetical protein
MQPTILVAADPEQAGREALALAAELARPVGGRLVLARVVLGYGRRPTHATQLRTAQRDQERLRASAVSGAGVEIEVISFPSLLRGLHDAPVIHGADLLVLGGDDPTAIERAVPDDLAAEVLFTAPCVVAIATGERRLEGAPKRIGGRGTRPQSPTKRSSGRWDLVSSPVRWCESSGFRAAASGRHHSRGRHRRAMCGPMPQPLVRSAHARARTPADENAETRQVRADALVLFGPLFGPRS